MGKVKAGDYVKVLQSHPYLDITANEIARVAKVSKKGSDGNREYVVDFADYEGALNYRLGLASSDFEKVGKKLKKKKVIDLRAGDKVILEGDAPDKLRHAEVYVVTAVRDMQPDKSIAIIGDDFEVHVPFEEIEKKVRVVV